MCTSAGCNGGRRRRKQPEELGGNSRVGWEVEGCWGGLEVEGGAGLCCKELGVLIQGLLTC